MRVNLPLQCVHGIVLQFHLAASPFFGIVKLRCVIMGHGKCILERVYGRGRLGASQGRVQRSCLTGQTASHLHEVWERCVSPVSEHVRFCVPNSFCSVLCGCLGATDIIAYVITRRVCEYFMMQWKVRAQKCFLVLVLFVYQGDFLLLRQSLTHWGCTWAVTARQRLHTCCRPNPIFFLNKISLSAVGPWCKLINSLSLSLSLSHYDPDFDYLSLCFSLLQSPFVFV